jgi:hypothetical protein
MSKMTVGQWIQELAQFDLDMDVYVDFTPLNDSEIRADKIKFVKRGRDLCIECEEA